MFLESLKIENFKGFGDNSDPIPIRPITILLGPNSAGKSSIIQAICLAVETLEKCSANVSKTALSGDFIDLGGYYNYVNRQTNKDTIKIEFQFSYPMIKPITTDECKFQLVIPGPEFPQLWYNDIPIYKESPYTHKIDIDESEIAEILIKKFDLPWFPKPMIRVHDFECVWEGNMTPSPNESGLFIKFEFDDLVLDLITDNQYKPIGDINIIEKIKKWKSTDYKKFIKKLKKFNKNFINHIIDFKEFQKGIGYLGPIRKVIGSQGLDASTINRPDGSDSIVKIATSTEVQGQIKEINHWLTRVQDKLQLKEIKTIQTGQLFVDQIITAMWAADQDRSDITGIDEYRDNFESYLNSGKVNKPITFYKLILHDDVRGIDLGPNELGIGISQFIPVLFRMLDPDYKLAMFEQPELHLHPKAQSELGDLLLYAALGYESGNSGPSLPLQKKTIIIETHSEHILLRILKRIREEYLSGNTKLAEELANSVALIYVETVSQDTPVWLQLDPNNVHKTTFTKAQRIEINSNGSFAQEWPYGFFMERISEL